MKSYQIFLFLFLKFWSIKVQIQKFSVILIFGLNHCPKLNWPKIFHSQCTLIFYIGVTLVSIVKYFNFILLNGEGL